MRYIPKYPKEKLEILRKYVEDFFNSFYKKQAASTITEAYSTRITKKPTNGDARYKFFNNLFFKGELPNTVKVYFVDSTKNNRSSTGFTDTLRRKHYLDFKSLSKNVYGAWYPDSKTIYVFLDRLEQNDFAIDSVLVHEMCHVWQDTISKSPSKTDHGFQFQYAKNKVKKQSKNIYNVGAFHDAHRKAEEYNNGSFGNPTLGRDKYQIEDYYKKRMNTYFVQNKHSLWKLENIKDKSFKFELGNQRVYFRDDKFVGFSPMTKTLAASLNRDDNFLKGVKERFEKIKNSKGF